MYLHTLGSRSHHGALRTTVKLIGFHSLILHIITSTYLEIMDDDGMATYPD